MYFSGTGTKVLDILVILRSNTESCRYAVFSTCMIILEEVNISILPIITARFRKELMPNDQCGELGAALDVTTADDMWVFGRGRGGKRHKLAE